MCVCVCVCVCVKSKDLSGNTDQCSYKSGSIRQ